MLLYERKTPDSGQWMWYRFELLGDELLDPVFGPQGDPDNQRMYWPRFSPDGSSVTVVEHSDQDTALVVLAPGHSWECDASDLMSGAPQRVRVTFVRAPAMENISCPACAIALHPLLLVGHMRKHHSDEGVLPASAQMSNMAVRGLLQASLETAVDIPGWAYSKLEDQLSLLGLVIATANMVRSSDKLRAALLGD